MLYCDLSVSLSCEDSRLHLKCFLILLRWYTLLTILLLYLSYSIKEHLPNTDLTKDECERVIVTLIIANILYPRVVKPRHSPKSIVYIKCKEKAHQLINAPNPKVRMQFPIRAVAGSSSTSSSGKKKKKSQTPKRTGDGWISKKKSVTALSTSRSSSKSSAKKASSSSSKRKSNTSSSSRKSNNHASSSGNNSRKKQKMAEIIDLDDTDEEWFSIPIHF